MCVCLLWVASQTGIIFFRHGSLFYWIYKVLCKCHLGRKKLQAWVCLSAYSCVEIARPGNVMGFLFWLKLKNPEAMFYSTFAALTATEMRWAVWSTPESILPKDSAWSDMLLFCSKRVVGYGVAEFSLGKEIEKSWKIVNQSLYGPGSVSVLGQCWLWISTRLHVCTKENIFSVWMLIGATLDMCWKEKMLLSVEDSQIIDLWWRRHVSFNYNIRLTFC